MTARQDLPYQALSDVATLIKNKKVSPVELTRLMLSRIEELDPKINAYYTVFSEQIMADARQAEAERERRAKVISAEGEYQAAEKLKLAAQTIADHPMALQMRYLQTLADMSSERSSIVVLPLPMEILRAFTSKKT